MVPLSVQAAEVLQSFQACRGWEARARLLLEYGKSLACIPPEQRLDKYLVHGCESPVWCLVELRDGGVHIQLDTDARLLRGLLAVLLSRIQGLAPDELATVDAANWFERLGLARQLSPSRNNGLQAVIQYIFCLAV